MSRRAVRALASLLEKGPLSVSDRQGDLIHVRPLDGRWVLFWGEEPGISADAPSDAAEALLGLIELEQLRLTA